MILKRKYMTVKKVNKIVATAMLLAVPAANGFAADIIGKVVAVVRRY